MALNAPYIKRSSETLRDIAGDVIGLLKQSGETIGVAESLTGGGIMAALTSVEGASAVFRGGVVSYATPLKQHLLKVDADLISQHGVIHADVAEQMAAGARTITGTGLNTSTAWGISTTGVAGPDSQDGKPVGMVFIGIASPEHNQALGPFHFPGDRDRVRQATVMEALSQLREILITRQSS
ncbi:CinA-like protein [Cladobotryum mycophilum]|uniref:CinA-like protein n=1 Tax=Cladobotryum mycophilum TaxID=491253 RepID=A0ABR0SPW5_9HYPO